MHGKMNGSKRGAFSSTEKKAKKGTFKRLLSMLFKNNKLLLSVVAVCLILSSVISVASSIFLKNLIDILEKLVGKETGVNAAWSQLTVIFIVMASVYALGILCSFLYNRLGAIITQNFLHDVRTQMFSKMQSLPISYFDSHNTGDVMSIYTNDTDALRQLVSQSLPQLISSAISLVTILYLMLSYSLWLAFVVILGAFIMLFVVKTIGGKSAKYFVRQQRSVGDVEGYIEEMMQGQKVVKVFCHEQKSKETFDEKNDELFKNMERANTFANILMPIMGNIGNILYVLVAFVAGILVASGANNVSLSGVGTISLGIIMAFLPVSRQFSNNISQASQHINSIVMGLAGAERIFELMDETPETDDGYVTLVNCNIDENGVITESATRTGKWAWKHPHKAEGTVTYTELKGDIQMFDVDFGYVKDRIVLHDVSLYAHPGQKVAFVGATGAGKTTITNLINRFYDIADGKIRYDGININKIKKADLRRSLGIVLQDTNLFTGTVMDNIRYGKLDATDDECIAAAKLAYAHDFITRLPDGYNTMLTADGANLSQGQRQLLSIARAAVKDAPVMILDEATSSIDTRTEALVQKGTDKLMEGRTVFVIAHRLSTVQNSDVIMVLENGRIIERGSHDELIEKRGKYYQLYTGAFELE